MPATPGAPDQYEAHRRACGIALTERPAACVPNVGAAIMKRTASRQRCSKYLRAVYAALTRSRRPGSSPAAAASWHALLIGSPSSSEKEELVKLLKEFEEKLEVEKPAAKTQSAIEASHVSMLGSTLKQALKVGDCHPSSSGWPRAYRLPSKASTSSRTGWYNNLIYMAVVLSELALNPDAAYKALIVEEPEAHLHPQLQVVLLDHLQDIETPVPGQKPVQVFVTSHSPHFASAAKLDLLACLHQGEGKIGAFFPREAAFLPKKKEKLQRYLDVTRADLFFARRRILVER